MSSYPIIAGEVVSKAEYVERATEAAKEVGRLAARPAAVDPMTAAYAKPEQLDAEPAVTQFAPVGLGKPLTVLVREIYTGALPKSLFGGAKPMVVVTGLKDYSTYAPTARAVNFLMKSVDRHTRFQAPSTFDNGTNVVAYSPAVLADSLHYTVEFAFDSFPDALFQTISTALSSVAGIPLLMPAQGYLLAASSVISTGANWADALIDGKASFSITDSLDFNIPGVAAPQAAFRVLAHFDPTGMKFDPARGLLNKDGSVYSGDEPYVVVSIDGAERKSLASFAPTVATAGVLKQFFNMRDGGEASAQAVMDGLKLVNDLKYRKDAIELQSEVGAERDATKKAALQAQLDAVLKNISNADLKKLP